MICGPLYRLFSIENLLSYLAEKIILMNITNFREITVGDLFNQVSNRTASILW